MTLGPFGIEPDDARQSLEEQQRDEKIVDAFWQEELHAGYELALKLTADKFSTTCAEVERLVTEDDELNNGNC